MSSPTPQEQNPAQRRSRHDLAAEEATLTLTKPIANWQARFGWACTMWGLIPVLGLPLGLLGVLFGYLGYRRVRGRPQDLGIRHAVGALVLGSMELLVNVVGIACIIKGVLTFKT